MFEGLLFLEGGEVEGSDGSIGVSVFALDVYVLTVKAWSLESGGIYCLHSSYIAHGYLVLLVLRGPVGERVAHDDELLSVGNVLILI